MYSRFNYLFICLHHIVFVLDNIMIDERFAFNSDQDALVLASNATPDWCEQLMMWCPMLCPFETRLLYFTCTAFGASRSVGRHICKLAFIWS